VLGLAEHLIQKRWRVQYFPLFAADVSPLGRFFVNDLATALETM
jgi:hypothetical protein